MLKSWNSKLWRNAKNPKNHVKSNLKTHLSREGTSTPSESTYSMYSQRRLETIVTKTKRDERSFVSGEQAGDGNSFKRTTRRLQTRPV